MVDRYSIASGESKVRQTFDIKDTKGLKKIYNAAPTKHLPVLTSDNPEKIEFFIWGLMSRWSNNKALSPKLFNVELDQLFSKRSYRQAIKKRRCVILADGFYLWKPIAKKKMSPYYFFMDQRVPFGIAGIWEPADEFDEGTGANFMMVTHPATQVISNYQNDMPFILTPDQVQLWLDETVEEEVLSNIVLSKQLRFSMHAVSPMIMDFSNNSEKLIEPNKPSDQHGNYTLFG